MLTESASERFRDLDRWPIGQVLEALWAGQSRAVAACTAALAPLGVAVEAAAVRLAASDTGRLVYVGAGSSGLLAAVDARELGPTFAWPEARLAILVADGLDLGRPLRGGPEDDAAAGAAQVAGLGCGAGDVVLGVSASGHSAFTVAAVAAARQAGTLTIGIASNADGPLLAAAEHEVVAETGEEVIAGSTRLGAGTAQKLLLNLFSTALMTRLGAVHQNLMVNARPENAKLRRRAVAMVARITGAEEEAAALARGGEVKTAVLLLAGWEKEAAEAALAAAGGSLRRVLERA
ncbi:MAG TPA: N-acetylmuramic acid 6-phosphate etherase [Acetobacteraceae bacterium]|nr:N-acetylmuramic acid 6-phosphate etherase [Acetobacteraceae bacterium]